jgi:glycosyltransferase involved in cell wall biosynthesis
MSTESTLPGSSPAARRHVVAFVTGGAAMAGVEYNAIRLAERLDRGRWDVVLVCPAEGDLTAAFRRAGLRVFVEPRRRLLSSSIRLGTRWRVPNPFACAWDTGVILGAARALGRVLTELRPDLVVTKGLFPHFYGALAARRCRVPCLWHAEDFISERWLGVFRRGFGAAARRLPSAIAVIGDPIAEQLPADVRPRVRVIHNGADTRAFRPGRSRLHLRREWAIPNDALVIGHVARLTPWKGQSHLLEAFARLAGEVPRARLLFVGSSVLGSDSYERRLKARSRELGLADRVVFAGYRHDVSRTLAAMDVLAYPSTEKDVCPLSLLEAMATGLPVVAFDIPGVSLVIDGPDDGLLVPVEDIGGLTAALRWLLTDYALRRRLGAGARRRIETAFNLESHVRLFEKAFLDLIAVPVPVDRRLSGTATGAKHALTPFTGVSIHDC